MAFAELEVPSKTFLVGEYAVLRGGPALIAATKPFFRFTAKTSSTEQTSAFHPESAAGRWFHQSEVLLRDWSIDRHDPHAGGGGFGASGAEFIFYHLLCTYQQSKSAADDPRDVWQDFKACDTTGASGADIVAQTVGGITFFQSEPFEAAANDWPFDETDFFILRTGHKLATHTHLAAMNAKADFTKLERANGRAVEGFFTGNVEAFAAGLSDFQTELRDLGLQAEHTREQLDVIRGCAGVLAAKGCGAMGADTLFVLVDRDFQSEFLAGVRSAGLSVIASTRDLASAPRLKVN